MSIRTDSGKGDQWMLKPWGERFLGNRIPKYHPTDYLLNKKVQFYIENIYRSEPQIVIKFSIITDNVSWYGTIMSIKHHLCNTYANVLKPNLVMKKQEDKSRI